MGDSGYNANSFMVTPIDLKGRPMGLTAAESYYNFRVSRVRCKVEISIGALKNRFQILRKRSHYDVKVVNMLFYVCCMLHNLIVNAGESLPYGHFDDLVIESFPSDSNFDRRYHNVMRRNLISWFASQDGEVKPKLSIDDILLI